MGPAQRAPGRGGLAPERLAETLGELTRQALAAAGPESDNVSVVALAWGEEAAPFRGERGAVPDAEVSTQVQDFGDTDPDFLRMTDEDIERAIDEIKQALKRQNTRR